jgi:transcriptional regulator with XRE-family HTH domain
MSALSDLLKAANANGGSARSIARSAKELGFTLNHDTAARYLRGDHGRPDEQTLVALGAVLDVPIGQLRRAASLPSEQTEPYQPPAEASRLSRRQRRAVDEIIRAMLDPSTETPEVPGSDAISADVVRLSTKPREPDDRPDQDEQSQAARRGASEQGDPPPG